MRGILKVSKRDQKSVNQEGNFYIQAYFIINYRRNIIKKGRGQGSVSLNNYHLTNSDNHIL
jgi:hypothetical protein